MIVEEEDVCDGAVQDGYAHLARALASILASPRRYTYDAKCANEDVWWRVVASHHLRNEIGSHSDDANEGHGLKHSDDLECSTKGTIL